MTETWCIMGNAGGRGFDLAASLLADGNRVAVITGDIAPFAMLVNLYADSIFTFEVTSLDPQFLTHAINTLDDSFGGIDTIAVVPTSLFLAATRRGAELLAQHWQTADLRFLTEDTLVSA